MRKALIYFILLLSAWGIVFRNDAIHAMREIPKRENGRSLSLCDLMKNVDRYNERLVRVRVVVLGTGGHYPFFVTAQDCDSESVVFFWVEFEHRGRSEHVLENRLSDVLHFNLNRESRKAEAIIVGRVSKRHSTSYSSSCLMLSVREVETDVPRSSRLLKNRWLGAVSSSS